MSTPAPTWTHQLGDVTLRLFEPDRDAERLRQIVAEIWGGGGYALMEQRFGPIGGKPWIDWMWPAVLADLQAEPQRSFVAEKDGQIVGFCSYSIDAQRDRGTVGYNGVARCYQGKGLGSAMIQFVMQRIRGEGVGHAVVIVQDNDEHAPARRIYEKQGFTKVSGNIFMAMKL